MSLIPKLFDEVSRFAALERWLRGAGSRGEYDYTIADVLHVAAIYGEMKEVWPVDADFVPKGRSLLNLHNAWKRHMQSSLAQEEASHAIDS